MTTTKQPASLHNALEQIRSVDQAPMLEAQARMDRKTRQQKSLGHLEEFARRFITITGREQTGKTAVVTFAADHGVAAEGVSAFLREVTAQMVYNSLNGGAAINAPARHAGAEVMVIDIGVDS